MDIQKPLNTGELFSYSADIFKKIFPRVFVLYALVGVAPAALYNAYVNPYSKLARQIALPASLLMMLFSIFIFSIVFFYILAEVKREPVTIGQSLKETGRAAWPLISSYIMAFLMAFAVAFADIIIIIFFTVIAKAGGKAAAVVIAIPALLFFIGAGLAFFYVLIRFYFFMNFALMEKTRWFKPFAQSWRLTKGNFVNVLTMVLIFLAFGFVNLLLKSHLPPLGVLIAMMVLSPVSFFLNIVFNLLFFNLYYMKPAQQDAPQNPPHMPGPPSEPSVPWFINGTIIPRTRPR